MKQQVATRLSLLAVLFVYTAFLTACRGNGSAVIIDAQTRTSEEWITDGIETEQFLENIELLEETVQQTSPTYRIVVHVAGQVQSPGVYELEEGSRIWDAVEAAGGFTEEAAQDAVNLASVLQDAMKITIPSQEEVRQGLAPSVTETAEMEIGNTTQTNNGLVNINTADKTGLMTIPGIGETRAEAILQYRKEHGSFAAIEDIMNVTGIKEGLFEKIREHITVGG